MALTKVTGSVIKDNVSLSGNVSVGGTLTYQDVTNVDALGIGTFRTGIKVLAGQVDVGSNIKLGNAGVVTATSFVGSGANLTSLPAQATIANNADNRVITGGSGVNLTGEANLTFDTTNGLVCDSGTVRCNDGFSSDVDLIFNADANNNGTGSIIFKESGSEKFRIDSSGRVMIGNTAAGQMYSGGDNLVIGTTSGENGITIISQSNSIGRILFSDSLSSGAATYQGQLNYNHSADELVLSTYTLGQIVMKTSQTERLRIDSSGNVTINTGNLTIPDSIIHSGDTDTKIVFDTNKIDLQAAGSSRLYVSQYAAYVQSGFPLAFLSSSGATPSIKSGGTNAQDLLLTSGTGNPTRLQIESGGNVRVSDEHLRFDTTGKGIIFGIDGGSNRPSIIGNYTSSSDNNMVFNVTGSERLRITSAGYLQQHKLIAVSYSDGRAISLSNADLTTSNFYNHTNFASDTSILDSNGHFVAPVHGIYRLYFRCTTDGTSGNRANVRLRKNGNTVNEAYANDAYNSVSSEIIMELNAGEYLDIQVGQLHTMSGTQHKVVNFHMLG